MVLPVPSGAGCIPALMPEECALLYKHQGCYKCRVPYAGHQGWECLNGFPVVHKVITANLCQVVKTTFEKNRWGQCGGGPAAHTSTRTHGLHIPPSPINPVYVTAISEDHTKDDDGVSEDVEDESSQVVAMTWPSAVALGNSNSEGS